MTEKVFKCVVKKCDEMGEERCIISQFYIDYKKDNNLEICPAGNKVKMGEINE
ncbi:MAG: hypothetical protein M0Q88_00235 [Bacilli bacterium]|nr:hypothetical protein [Bacilli bacterium]